MDRVRIQDPGASIAAYVGTSPHFPEVVIAFSNGRGTSGWSIAEAKRLRKALKTAIKELENR